MLLYALQYWLITFKKWLLYTVQFCYSDWHRSWIGHFGALRWHNENASYIHSSHFLGYKGVEWQNAVWHNLTRIVIHLWSASMAHHTLWHGWSRSEKWLSPIVQCFRTQSHQSGHVPFWGLDMVKWQKISSTIWWEVVYHGRLFQYLNIHYSIDERPLKS